MAVCLAVYALALSVLAPPLLLRANLHGAAPRLGVSAWLAVMASVLAASIGAFTLLVTHVLTSEGDIGLMVTGCLAGLGFIVHGGYGELLQVSFLALAAMSTLTVVVLGSRVVLAIRRSHRGSRDHVSAARIAAGDTLPGPGGALIIDSAQRGVYCLAGRPHTIVMTRGALDALDGAELAAVLAHERAHLSGRHHHVLAVTAALGAMLPRVQLFAKGASEIARLLEMCADDAAARRHSCDTIVDALVALSLPGPTSTSPMPAAALGATGLAVTQRVERLLFPPNRIRARLYLTVATGAALLGPLLAAALMLAPSICL